MKHLHALLSNARVIRSVAAASLALAAGGIVLLRAPHPGTAAPQGPAARTTTPGGAPKADFRGPMAHGRVALSQGAVQAGGTRQVYAEVRLTADAQPGAEAAARPVAMALVLDVSGSMSGEKIEQARASVLSVVEQMRDDDRIALVTYSDSARVVQTLARVADVRDRLRVVVPTIGIEGGTNIPSGLALGAQSLAGAPEGMVRRVVLMSDGRDGSGQNLESIADDLRARADGGVTLSSLGVGADYDEHYMTRLADAGRGNYEFLRDGAQLRAFLGREFQQATRTTVERAVAEVTLPAGWRLTRAYGAEAQSSGRTVRLPIGAIPAGEERRLVLDLAVDAPAAGDAGALAAHVTWTTTRDRRDVAVDVGALPLATAGTETAAVATRDAAVFAEAESTAISARQHDAVVAWRDGRAEEAQRVARANLLSLRALQASAPAPARAAQIRQFERDEAAFDSVSASSSEGRAYGLGANARHRAALNSATAY